MVSKSRGLDCMTLAVSIERRAELIKQRPDRMMLDNDRWPFAAMDLQLFANTFLWQVESMEPSVMACINGRLLLISASQSTEWSRQIPAIKVFLRKQHQTEWSGHLSVPILASLAPSSWAMAGAFPHLHSARLIAIASFTVHWNLAQIIVCLFQ